MVTGLFISIEHIAVRDELRRTDGPHTVDFLLNAGKGYFEFYTKK